MPAEAATRDARCHEIFNIQVQSLVQRLEASRIEKVLIGVSGGLDSTHALLVIAQAMDRLATAQPHPRIHDAGFRHQRPNALAGARADGGHWLHRA